MRYLTQVHWDMKFFVCISLLGIDTTHPSVSSVSQQREIQLKPDKYYQLIGTFNKNYHLHLLFQLGNISR